jgi:hypothetical protein
MWGQAYNRKYPKKIIKLHHRVQRYNPHILSSHTIVFEETYFPIFPGVAAKNKCHIRDQEVKIHIYAEND